MANLLSPVESIALTPGESLVRVSEKGILNKTGGSNSRGETLKQERNRGDCGWDA